MLYEFNNICMEVNSTFVEWFKMTIILELLFPRYMMECDGNTTEPHPQLQVVPTNIEFGGATNEHNIASELCKKPF